MWKKVIAPTALVSLIWVVVSCGTWHAVNQLDEAQKLLLDKNRNLIQADAAMQENLWRLQAALFETAEHRGKSDRLRETLEIEAKQLEDAFGSALTRAFDNAATADEQGLVRTIGENFERYRAALRERPAHDEISPEAAADSLYTAMRVASSVAKPCEQLSEVAQRLTNESFQQRDRLRAKINMARVAFIVVGPVVGILLALWVTRGLNYSISEISVTLRDASGDLEHEVGLVEVRSGDTIGDLPALQQQVQYVSGRIKQVVDELHSTRRKAVRSERLAALGELAAGVAHEVRNPLTSVKLLIQAIERNQSLGSADTQRLQIVQEEIGRIETTMQELLDFARPPKLRRVRHDARDTIRRTLNLASVRAKQSKVAIEEQLGETPVIVDADPDQLQQVLINLLLNGIEAMPAGGTLSLAVERPALSADGHGEQAPNGLLRIVFRDTGSGIRPDVMERLFEPFVTSKDRGIGLGLAISRQIMQEHGGRLTASNAPHCGAEFIVEMPLAKVAIPDRRECSADNMLADARKASGLSRDETHEIVNH